LLRAGFRARLWPLGPVMPVSGLKVKDLVLTPSGRRARVVSVNKVGPATARVRYEDTGTIRYFRQAALKKSV
jgi:hypothetical protein